MVTESSATPSGFELTYCTRECVAHKFIESSGRGVRFEHADVYFPSLVDLVAFYQTSRGDELACPLRLSTGSQPATPARPADTRRRLCISPHHHSC